MVKVITQKKIAHAGLFTCSLHGRMGAGSTYKRRPAKIGNAKLANFAVIIFCVMY